MIQEKDPSTVFLFETWAAETRLKETWTSKIYFLWREITKEEGWPYTSETRLI